MAMNKKPVEGEIKVIKVIDTSKKNMNQIQKKQNQPDINKIIENKQLPTNKIPEPSKIQMV